jgi:hypothetical protein
VVHGASDVGLVGASFGLHELAEYMKKAAGMEASRKGPKNLLTLPVTFSYQEVEHTASIRIAETAC